MEGGMGGGEGEVRKGAWEGKAVGEAVIDGALAGDSSERVGCQRVRQGQGEEASGGHRARLVFRKGLDGRVERVLGRVANLRRACAARAPRACAARVRVSIRLVQQSW
jgi:hypothetical protein